jgi:hypothetical protein
MESVRSITKEDIKELRLNLNKGFPDRRKSRESNLLYHGKSSSLARFSS